MEIEEIKCFKYMKELMLSFVLAMCVSAMFLPSSCQENKKDAQKEQIHAFLEGRSNFMIKKFDIGKVVENGDTLLVSYSFFNPITDRLTENKAQFIKIDSEIVGFEVLETK